MSLKIKIPEEVLDEFFRVSPISCQKYPRRGIPCASCSENESCEQVQFKEVEFGDGVLKKAGNSAMLSVRIPKKSDLDELLLRQLVKGMVEDKKYMLIQPLETFDVTFYVAAEMAAGGIITGQTQRKALIRAVLEFLSSKPIEGRLRIHDWSRKEIESFDHKVRREYKDTWKEVEDVIKSTPLPVERAVRSAVTERSQMLTQTQTGTGGAPATESPTAIIRFLKEDAEKGEAKYAQKFVESSTSGRPLIPRAKAEEPLVGKEYLPRKAAIIEEVPALPTGDQRSMLEHIQKLVEADLPARFISDRIERVRDELRRHGFWGKSYLDMGSVSRRMFQYHEGYALSMSEKKQILDKLKTWMSEVR